MAEKEKEVKMEHMLLEICVWAATLNEHCDLFRSLVHIPQDTRSDQ